jgi:suppressor of ftsI
MSLSRRHVLGLLGGGAGAVAAASTGALGGWAALALQSNPTSAPLGKVLRSSDGVLRVQLATSPGTAIVNGSAVPGMTTYNGEFPAPTLIVKPGDRMRIRLINNGSTITNLHFHGMHVSPRGHQDNVFIEVEPGNVHEYDVKIPQDHPGGLFWYHPHHHTESGPQVWAGLSGLLIVEGGAALLPQVRGLRKHSIALREGGLGPDGAWADYTTLSPDDTQFYVNGMLNPRITIRPGETQFWQIGNIGVATYYALGLDDHEFTVVEEDGAMVWRTWQTDTLIMPPGKRYGILVTAKRGRGTFRLRQLGYNQGKAQWPARPLMRMRITGDQDRPVSVPTHLADPPSWLTGPVANRRVLTLSQDIVDGDPQFYIDGLIFDELTFKDVIEVKLGSTEEWVIRNASSKIAGSPENEEHPFHIHVNWDPLTNKTSNRQVAPMRSYSDTETIPWNAYMRFRTHFADYIGRSVYHCHLLFHEDHGMMGAFDIVDADGEGAGPGQHLPSHH